MSADWMWIAAGTVTFGFVVAARFRPMTQKQALAQWQRTGDLAPLAGLIAAKPADRQATAWDQAIKTLWQSYEREAAARLTVEAAQRCDAKIIQYWMKQIMEIEPGIASRVFTQAFLDSYFNPEVAASCGRCGSCGCSK